MLSRNWKRPPKPKTEAGKTLLRQFLLTIFQRASLNLNPVFPISLNNDINPKRQIRNIVPLIH